MNMDNRIVALSNDTRIRHEGESYILINIATQGLHFISPIAFEFIEQLDGVRTVDGIVSALWPQLSPADYSVISAFVDKLLERRILVMAQEVR